MKCCGPVLVWKLCIHVCVRAWIRKHLKTHHSATLMYFTHTHAHCRDDTHWSWIRNVHLCHHHHTPEVSDHTVQYIMTDQTRVASVRPFSLLDFKCPFPVIEILSGKRISVSKFSPQRHNMKLNTLTLNVIIHLSTLWLFPCLSIFQLNAADKRRLLSGYSGKVSLGR